ncbi:MAG: PIN domain-containing protein [Deltaproteobacteria bacterium]|nr:PIN domain-containing protein [Deltaproteobacteria bacterium]
MNKVFLDTSVILRLLIKDDDLKTRAIVRFIKNSKDQNLVLYLLPVALLETVWVLEKVYGFGKTEVRQVVDAILNTPEFRVEMSGVFKKAIQTYEEKNIKFADAVMGHWGLEKGYATVITYDEKDFKRIEGLEVKKP